MAEGLHGFSLLVLIRRRNGRLNAPRGPVPASRTHLGAQVPPSRVPGVQRNLRGSDGRALSERFAGLTLHSEALRPRIYKERTAGASGAHSQAERPPQLRRGRSGGGAALGRGLRSRPLQSAPFGAVGGGAGLGGPPREASWGCALPRRPGRGARAWGALGRWGHPLPSAWAGGRGAALPRDPWLSPTQGPIHRPRRPLAALGPASPRPKVTP